jgi:hypothetical protein
MTAAVKRCSHVQVAAPPNTRRKQCEFLAEIQRKINRKLRLPVADRPAFVDACRQRAMSDKWNMYYVTVFSTTYPSQPAFYCCSFSDYVSTLTPELPRAQHQGNRQAAEEVRAR